MEVVPDEHLDLQTNLPQTGSKCSAKLPFKALDVKYRAPWPRSLVTHAVNFDRWRRTTPAGNGQKIHELCVSTYGWIDVRVNELQRVRTAQNRSQVLLVIVQGARQTNRWTAAAPPSRHAEPVNALHTAVGCIFRLDRLRDDNSAREWFQAVSQDCLFAPVLVVERSRGKAGAGS